MATFGFVNVPAQGHVAPTLPIVAELIRRGERVVYWCHDEYEDSIADTGAEFRPYRLPDAMDPGRPPANPLALAAMLWEATVAVLPGLIDAMRREGLDHVVHDSFCPWGKAAAMALGLPRTCSTTIFAFTAAMALNPKRLRLLPPLGGSLAAYGAFQRAAAALRRDHADLRPRFLDALACDAPTHLLHTSAAIQPSSGSLPPSHRFVGRRFSTNTEGAPRDEGGMLVYVSLGTIFNENSGFFRLCFEALREIEGRVIISVGNAVDPQVVGAVPANITLAPRVDQLAVLRRTRVFITHAGMNSVHEALYLGVPMVLVPQAADQHVVADRVASLGAGIVADEARLTAASLASAVREVAAGAYARRSRELGATLHAAGGHERAADILQESVAAARC